MERTSSTYQVDQNRIGDTFRRADQVHDICNKRLHARGNNYVHNYYWDYNTRKSCQYCQEYGHTPHNYIRKHFKSNYNKWLNQTTYYSCLKTRHVSRNCPTKVKAPKTKVNKGKEKVNVENIKVDIKKTW